MINKIAGALYIPRKYNMFSFTL